MLLSPFSTKYNVERAIPACSATCLALFPNWTGQTQPRVVKIEGDFLYLSTAAPIMSSGKEVNSFLKWKRAAAE